MGFTHNCPRVPVGAKTLPISLHSRRDGNPVSALVCPSGSPQKYPHFSLDTRGVNVHTWGHESKSLNSRGRKGDRGQQKDAPSLALGWQAGRTQTDGDHGAC